MTKGRWFQVPPELEGLFNGITDHRRSSSSSFSDVFSFQVRGQNTSDYQVLGQKLANDSHPPTLLVTFQGHRLGAAGNRRLDPFT